MSTLLTRLHGGPGLPISLASAPDIHHAAATRVTTVCNFPAAFFMFIVSMPKLTRAVCAILPHPGLFTPPAW